MSRVEDALPTREVFGRRQIPRRDRDVSCPDPLVEFCKNHLWYDKLDKFLNNWFLFAVPIVIVLAIITGLIIKWGF